MAFLNKVISLLVFTFVGLLFISSVLQRNNRPESLISMLELRKARLLKHCSSKKRSQGPSMTKLNSPEPPMKNLHFVRNLPGDVAFCLLKKAGSTSLTHFFTNNLEPAEEMTWLVGLDQTTREQIVRSRSSLRVMVVRHPFTRLVSAFNHLFRWGLHDQGLFLCDNPSNVARGCKTENFALAKKIMIEHIRPSGRNDTMLQFPEFVRFLINSGNEFTALQKHVNENWSGLASHWQPFSSQCSPCLRGVR